MEITEHSTSNRLFELVRNLKEIDRLAASGQSATLQTVEWVYPLSCLPLAVFAEINKIEIKYSGKNINISSYLDTICFPKGTETLATGGNYLPITKIKCGIKNSILSDYEEWILSEVSEKYRKSFINGLKYLTSELQTNVEEHAKIGHYWLLAQYWPKTKVCEICMADTGRGYKESYKGTQFEVESHGDAIRNALDGKSSKKLEGRGAGIPGIIRMFIEGYRGELVIMSGDALLYLSREKQSLYKCPVVWQGSLICLKFTLREIGISKYYY